MLSISPLNAEPTHALGLKWFGLSIHPYGAINAALEPLKLDGRGVLVPNLGLMASYEFFLLPWLSVKLAQAGYFDCALQPSGISYLGFRGYFVNARNTVIGGGIGPTWIYRKTWTTLPGYLPYSFYKNAGSIDWAFLWYGGEFEWDQRLRNDLWFSLAIIPGWPDLINFSVGVKWKP